MSRYRAESSGSDRVKVTALIAEIPHHLFRRSRAIDVRAIEVRDKAGQIIDSFEPSALESQIKERLREAGFGGHDVQALPVMQDGTRGVVYTTTLSIPSVSSASPQIPSLASSPGVVARGHRAPAPTPEKDPGLSALLALQTSAREDIERRAAEQERSLAERKELLERQLVAVRESTASSLTVVERLSELTTRDLQSRCQRLEDHVREAQKRTSDVEDEWRRRMTESDRGHRTELDALRSQIDVIRQAAEDRVQNAKSAVEQARQEISGLRLELRAKELEISNVRLLAEGKSTSSETIEKLKLIEGVARIAKENGLEAGPLIAQEMGWQLPEPEVEAQDTMSRLMRLAEPLMQGALGQAVRGPMPRVTGDSATAKPTAKSQPLTPQNPSSTAQGGMPRVG